MCSLQSNQELKLSSKELVVAGNINCYFYTEFTKKNVFEQLTLAVACSARRRPASGEISMSECDVTWRTVKVELLSSSNNYPHKISCDFPVFFFYFSIVS